VSASARDKVFYLPNGVNLAHFDIPTPGEPTDIADIHIRECFTLVRLRNGLTLTSLLMPQRVCLIFHLFSSGHMPTSNGPRWCERSYFRGASIRSTPTLFTPLRRRDYPISKNTADRQHQPSQDIRVFCLRSARSFNKYV